MLPNTSKSTSGEADITKFLPPEWDAWLPDDADISTQSAHSDLHRAAAATGKVLDECNVLSSVLEEELAETNRQLKQ